MIFILSFVALGAGLGFLMGAVFVYMTSTLPVVRMIARMRYDGFRPEAPPVKPKTVPSAEAPLGD